MARKNRPSDGWCPGRIGSRVYKCKTPVGILLFTIRLLEDYGVASATKVDRVTP
jgi:hypothetical protein